ncbi:golgin subfamily A member 4-like [Bombyx mandarina]|uniref:Golgin subfamily A member 4-like n=1 Tax=Bombyx mandarina TaxID=7092 RepID=A0A6J2K4D7_BOMMA|nr:golgin subfamily A member 4-like [Bombyx mandarina]
MFKKLKDKLAEEVKSSPQRIQQFAQAAQAAVTSASSSISDITNSDLFSIGENDSQTFHSTKSQPSTVSQSNTFRDVSPMQTTTTESTEYNSGQDLSQDNERQRRLSNSSFASDVSFRLPSYDTPMMYHLQSDIEVSASEAEERGLNGSTVSLDRVTKEQLYAAYKRTQERYKKYRTQYGDLARHYKLLERENTKARSVLVETQDKALRRISELREQCSLEQSAKAHLEKALRVEIEEKNMKIETLNTKIQFLSNSTSAEIPTNIVDNNKIIIDKDSNLPLINLVENETKVSNDESKLPVSSDLTVLNEKMEKMELLIQKYKESLKSTKDKNSQLITELQIMTNKLENKSKEVEEVSILNEKYRDASAKIKELENLNEELQNKINSYDFNESKKVSELETDLQKANEEVQHLQKKIEVFSKREEEYAISLAENKLSIHKELESKESEIKSLKHSLTASKKEIQSLSIVVTDYKNSIEALEQEKSKLVIENSEIATLKSKVEELETHLQELNKKNQIQEQQHTKLNEEYKCLQLQLKQEMAEKLAMMDRNAYLENRISQISEEISKKSSQVNQLESKLQSLQNDKSNESIGKEKEILTELNIWKSKYDKLESEMQEEREELVKLQSEIEKLIENHEHIQKQNVEFRTTISDLQAETSILNRQLSHYNKIKNDTNKILADVGKLRELITLTSKDIFANVKDHVDMIKTIKIDINNNMKELSNNEHINYVNNEELRNECLLLQRNINDITALQSETNKTLTKLKEENVSLTLTIQKLTADLQEKIDVDEKYWNASNDLNSLRSENQRLSVLIKDYENTIQNLRNSLDLQKSQLSTLQEEVICLRKEKELFEENLNKLQNINKDLASEQDKHKNAIATNVEMINILRTKNDDLLEKSDELNNKLINYQQLEEHHKLLTQENSFLKSQTENIASNVRELEFEINEVRKSHSAIESEKEHLSNVIEQIENRRTLLVSKDTQTEYNEIETELDKEKNLSNIKIINELSEKYDALKGENRRLLSDIEGLQTHLTKTSKENSLLNDKLREQIATSETGNYMSHDLNNDIRLAKDKIDHLTRENTLLNEENLELKDQLQSQEYCKPTNADQCFEHKGENELSEIKEKYYTLIQANSKIEQKNIDLEQLNKSLNVNIQDVQAKNEKLKLSNEKIERRLDEALVSLRHLHSLEENTELEYLRNILYEYLTGSGTHSITLAKVLAAVVKFDDKQTQMVLQKEKERQGFLRQLRLT